jgi:glycine/D-amino acid oxidase-like deaminating enzyme
MSAATTAPCECEVVIVGAGIAGASAAYHLMKSGVSNVVIIEAGSKAGEGIAPRRSGSATMAEAPAIKMMVQLFASSSDEFIHHHGKEGAKRYLRLTAEGLELQKEIARQVIDQQQQDQPSSEALIRELGSYYVAYEKDKEELRKEYESLKALGCDDIEWMEKEQLLAVAGCSNDFDCAILFPKDAVIDSSAYAKGLLRVVQEKGGYHFMSNTKVTQIIEYDDDDDVNNDIVTLVELDSGVRIRCQHVVMATGGLFPIPQLNGLLKPCYSYLVHVPISPTITKTTTKTTTTTPTTTATCDHSPNFFTWGFTHDWCFTNGKVRISGEDHYSAYKAPLCKERCANLTRWTLERYGVADQAGCSSDSSLVHQQYGVYSETPDLAPLIGHLSTSKSKVCYLLGCNAWGQTVLSYSSSLVSGLLGYKELDQGQRDSLKLLSIRRFQI